MKYILVTAVAVAAAAFGVSAEAQERQSTEFSRIGAPLTRAEVIAELKHARAAGELANPADSYGFLVSDLPRSSLTRAEVVAEYIRARDAGELNDRGELYGMPSPSSVKTIRSRAEVKQELENARRQGALELHNYSGLFRIPTSLAPTAHSARELVA